MKKLYFPFFLRTAFAVLLMLTAVKGWGQTTATYTTPGTYTWTCPPGTTSIQVEAWGGGGAGGGVGTAPLFRVAGGGGGGTYAKSTSIPVVSGSTYTITVGAGGTGVSAANGNVGGSSSFNSVVIATGGFGGLSNNTAGSVIGGVGGSGATGNITWNGGLGGSSNGTGTMAAASGGGGGGGGSTANGGNANISVAGSGGVTGGGTGAAGIATNTSGPGNIGNSPGGGGSGARGGSSNNTARLGGAGGDGKVVLTYTGYCTPVSSAATTYLSNVQTSGGITNFNNSSVYTSPGYANYFSTISASQAPASNFALTFTLVGGTAGVAVWIDWSKNNVFDPGEIVYNSNGYLATGTTLTPNITVPAAQAPGDYVLRILTDFNATSPISCSYTGTRGEAEDYKFTVTAASASPVLNITGTMAHGSVCPGVAATSQTYTIGNTGTSAAAGVTVVSDNPEFVVSALSSTTIPGSGGTATYVVTFTPSSAGAKTATITVASTTSGSTSPTSSLTGTGTTPVTQAVSTAAATAVTGTTATLNGTVNTLGVCPASIEKGFVYSVTTTNNDPMVAGTGVTKVAVAGMATGNYSSPLNTLTVTTGYSYKAYIYNGTTYTYGALQTFTTATSPVNDLCGDATGIVVNDPAINGTLVSASNSPGLSYAATKTDVWYKFTPTCSGKFTVDLNFASSTTDLDLDIFTGNCPTTGSATYTSHGSSNFETITNNFVSGTTYYIRVIAFNTAAESSTFTISINNQIAILTQPTDQSVAVGSTASFGVSSPANQTGRQWQVLTTDVGAVWTDIPGATGSPYVTPTTTLAMNGYQYRAVISNGTCSSITSNAATLTVTTCSSIPASNDGSGITSVTVGSATFPVTDVTQYTYTGSIPNLSQGANINSSITFATGFTYDSHIWIDFNDDGVFNNTNEKVYTGVSLSANPTTLNTSFILGGSVALGQHKMRIGTADSGQATPTPCYSGTFGVTIDLNVNIIAAPANPVLAISGTPINHGTVCPGISATPVTYTITNTGTAAATGVTVDSNNAEFAVSALSSTTIAGNGGIATYVVTFTPSTAGVKSAIITVASATSGSNSPTSSLTGTGNTAVSASVSTGAVSQNTTGNTATLNASAATLGVCPNTTVKGFVISKTSDNAAPTVGAPNVTNQTVTPIGGNGAYLKAITGLTVNTTYSYRAYLYDGTTYTYGAVVTFTTPLVSTATDYFRSKTSGNWSALATWESSSTATGTYIPATLIPNESASGVLVTAVHTVNINTSNIYISNTSVFGTLKVTTSSPFFVNGPDLTELAIENGGVLDVSAVGYPSYSSTAYILVKSGGKIVANPGADTDFIISDYIDSAGASFFEDKSIFEWNIAAYPPSTNDTFFPIYNDDLFFPITADAVPIFRISNTSSATNFSYGSASNPTTVNGVLEINTVIPFNIGGSTRKTFVGGITGTGVVNQLASSGNIFLGNTAIVPQIAGTVTINIQDNSLKLPNGANVPGTANVIIQSVTGTQNHRIHRQGGNLTIDGTLDIANLQITNVASGSTIINGTLKITNTAGLYGPGSAIPSGVLTINDNSTVEYSRLGAQTITNQTGVGQGTLGNYSNLKISGSGIKTAPVGDTNVQNITTVTAGELLVPSTAENVKPNSFTANKGLIVNAGAVFRLANNANLLQDATAVNTGEILAVRDLNFSALRQQYNYLISPLIGKNLKDIYKDGAGNPVTVPFILYHSETNNKFFNSSGAYIAGRALAVKEAAGSGTAVMSALFNGVPMNGSFNYTLLNSNTSNSANGYNLIGNPYPSNLDLQQFYDNNKSSGKLVPTFYLWDNKANDQYTQAGSGYGGEAYAQYNVTTPTQTGTGILATGDINFAGTKRPTRYVKIGQGFMARTEFNNLPITFDNTVRKPEISEGFFGKNASESAPFDRFWLNMKSPTNITSQIAVVYFAGGDNGYTRDDSRSLLGSDAIYSIVDSQPVSINGKDNFMNTDVVPLGSKHFLTGNYTIELDEQKDGIFGNGQNIYLKDRQSGTITNLSQSSYTFAANAGESVGRFEIIYKPESVLVTDSAIQENLVIYREGQDFVIQSTVKKINEVEVYDTNGRLIYTVQPHAAKVYLQSDYLTRGVYLLKIKQGDLVTTKKIIK